jgi:hypothetical protein
MSTVLSAASILIGILIMVVLCYKRINTIPSTLLAPPNPSSRWQTAISKENIFFTR